MATYKEHIGRYRIVFHEEYSDAVKAEFRINGTEEFIERDVGGMF